MSFEERIFAKKNALIKREELSEAKIISDHQGNPADFEGELLEAMHRRRAEVDAVLKVPENFKLPKPIEYPKKCPIENWEELIDPNDYKIDQNVLNILRVSMDNKTLNISKYPAIENLFRRRGIIHSEREMLSEDSVFSDDFFQAINEITKDNQNLNFLLQKTIEQNEKPDIKKLENAFEISHKLKSEKEIYIIGRLFENGLNSSYFEEDFFDRIKDINIFEKVLAMVKDLDDDDYFYVNLLPDICQAIIDHGEDFFDKILAANEKMKVLRKQPFFEKYMQSGWESSIWIIIKKNPYFCEALQNFNLEDIGYATEILDKINLMESRYEEKMNICEFIYFANLTKNAKQKIQEAELSSDFSEKNGLNYYKPSEIILYLTQTSSELSLKERLSSNESSTKKEVIANYIKENMPFMEDLVKDFEIENNLDIYNSNLSVIHEKTANLRFLSSRPEFAQFIKNNFEIENLLQLSKVVEVILKNRIDPQFEFIMIAEREFERTIENNNDKKKIENLLFISKEYKPEFIYWMVDLYKKTGFNIIDSINQYSYADSKIKTLRRWYDNAEIYSKALSWGILKEENDDRTGEYTSNIYKYDSFEYILNDEKFLKFALDNKDTGILPKAVSSSYGVAENNESKSVSDWYNDENSFAKAKKAGLFMGEGNKQTKIHIANIYRYERISQILNDEKFVKFALENRDINILQRAIDSYDERENTFNESIMGWYNDSKSFSLAKKIGILSESYADYIYYYEKFHFLGGINESQATDLISILNLQTLDRDLIIKNLERIISDSKDKSLYPSVFKILLENGLLDNGDIEGFHITKENFCDYLGENEPLIQIEKDRGLITDPVPWSKEWFLEDKSRFDYLNKDVIQTFKKFGTNIALALLGGTKDSKAFKDLYSNSVENITRESERSTVLQLGEIFSLVISRGSFEILDQLVDNEVPIGETFKKFMADYEISEKGKTILTLLIAREINTAYYAKTENDIKDILKSVYEKLSKYNEVIGLYKKENIPEGLRTSIGMEYEVTWSIADGYKKRTASDYKKDIEILSCYSGIAKGNDAIHEIATRPTDNPYLLLLEMKLLSDLDFVDLNFEHVFKDTDYEKGSRSFHITLGGEFGIGHDGYANFIQNSLVAGDLGGINAGELVGQVNRYSNIRAKGSDCEKIFNQKTETTEFRALSIDRAEPFERCVLSIFNLNMAKQALNKYFPIEPDFIKNISEGDLKDQKSFINYCRKNKALKSIGSKIEDDRIWKIILNFIKMQHGILGGVENHNKNFLENETFAENVSPQLSLLINGLIEGGKQGKLLASKYLNLDFKDMVKLASLFPISEELFFKRLAESGKIKSILPSDKHKYLMYLWFKKYISEPIRSIEKDNPNFFKKHGDLFVSGEALNGFQNRMQNEKRFEGVISSDKTAKGKSIQEYVKEIKVEPEEFYGVINHDFVNVFTKIHNLYLKPPTGTVSDSVNAKSVFDSTKVVSENGTEYNESDLDAPKRTIFDNLDRGMLTREGRYNIQGSSDKMIINVIQQEIINFNRKMKAILEK